MNTSNLGLARECGAYTSAFSGDGATFTLAQLDAFAERIRADERETSCRHRIADARNPVVKSGYVCIDCGALFSAADHAPVQPLVLVKAKPVVRPVSVDVCMKEMRAAFIDVTIHAQSAYAVLDYIATLESALRQALEGKS